MHWFGMSVYLRRRRVRLRVMGVLLLHAMPRVAAVVALHADGRQPTQHAWMGARKRLQSSSHGSSASFRPQALFRRDKTRVASLAGRQANQRLLNPKDFTDKSHVQST